MRIVAVLAAATAAGCLSTPGPASTDASVIDTPEIDAPEIDAPDVDAPDIDAPDIDAPDIDAEIDAPPCLDGDGDGWFTCGTYVDCFDDDADQHPGAIETMGGPDRDCNGSGHNTARQRIQVALIGGGDGAINVTTASARYDLQDTAAHQLGQILISGTQVLYTSTDNNERWSGVHAWENDFSTQATDDAQTVLVSGNGVARVRVTWSDGNLTAGTTTYTFVADGRVIRTDDFTITGPNAGSSITNYVALQASLFPELRWGELDGTDHDQNVTVPGSGFTVLVGQAAGVDGFLCARLTGTREVGFTAIGRPVPTRGLRATVGAGGQLAEQFDWSFAPVGTGRHVGHAMIYAGGSPMEFPCAESEIRARTFRNPVTLFVDSGGGIPFDPDDLGPDGYFEEGGYFAIAASASAVEFHMMGGAGMTFGPYNLFRITGLPSAGFDPVVLRAGTPLVHGRDYFVDHQSDGTMWLYTMVSFSTDHIQVITPAASCPTCAN